MPEKDDNQAPAKVENWEDQVKFDIYRVNTRVMNKFFASAGNNDFESIAEVFSICLLSIPKEWGDPQNIDDLLDNIPYPCMRQMLTMFQDAFKDAQKN